MDSLQKIENHIQYVVTLSNILEKYQLDYFLTIAVPLLACLGAAVFLAAAGIKPELEKHSYKVLAVFTAVFGFGFLYLALDTMDKEDHLAMVETYAKYKESSKEDALKMLKLSERSPVVVAYNRVAQIKDQLEIELTELTAEPQ